MFGFAGALCFVECGRRELSYTTMQFIGNLPAEVHRYEFSLLYWSDFVINCRTLYLMNN